jgi:hypothetical protein
MLTDEKEKIKKEIEPTVRRLNFLTRLLNADPTILTALTEKLLGKGVTVPNLVENGQEAVRTGAGLL